MGGFPNYTAGTKQPLSVMEPATTRYTDTIYLFVYFIYCTKHYRYYGLWVGILDFYSDIAIYLYSFVSAFEPSFGIVSWFVSFWRCAFFVRRCFYHIFIFHRVYESAADRKNMPYTCWIYYYTLVPQQRWRMCKFMSANPFHLAKAFANQFGEYVRLLLHFLKHWSQFAFPSMCPVCVWKTRNRLANAIFFVPTHIDAGDRSEKPFVIVNAVKC